MGFPKPEGKIAVIGGANLDITGIPFNGFIPRDSNPGRVELSPGGVARNVCENLARMGAQTVLFTVVSKDPNGQHLIESCASVGADTSCVMVCEDMSTSVYLSINDADGDMYCAIADMEIINRMSPEYLERFEDKINACSSIFIDTNLSEETIGYITHRFGHLAIFADPVSTAKAVRLTAYLDKIHTLKPNRNEVSLLSGVYVDSIEKAQTAAEVLYNKGVRNVAVSLGEQGLLICRENTKAIYKPPSISMASANGAGDALMAGLIFSHMCNLNLDDTLKTSCAAARIALSDKRTVSNNMTAERLFKEVTQ